MIITLTTIPPRMNTIIPTLNSLLMQTADIEKIYLFIPKKYRRPEFDDYVMPDYPDGIEVQVVEFDYGPATKILPAIKKFSGQDKTIIFCDDDRIYDSGWAQRLLDASEKMPDHCIVERGFNLDRIEAKGKYNTKNLAYRLKRLFSLGKWKASAAAKPGEVDVLEGYGGVLVKPRFFNEDVFEIPDVLWTVDDTWLSGNLAVNGVKIWLNQRPDTHAESSVNSHLEDEFALHKLSHGGGRNSADYQCMIHYRKNFGVWQGTANSH